MIWEKINRRHPMVFILYFQNNSSLLAFPFNHLSKAPSGKLSNWVSLAKNSLLCTVDVMWIYPSIPNREGLKAIREALGRSVSLGIAADTLIGLASLVHDNNYFEFNDRIYRQKLGTTIGTKFARAYANLFMSRLDGGLLKASVDKPLVWLRVIDDIFLIWAHGEEKLNIFINFLNSSHETIKFTSEYSQENISFLDQGCQFGLFQAKSLPPHFGLFLNRLAIKCSIWHGP